VVAIEVELVIPVEDPSEPCYEAETIELLREVKEHAMRGDLAWLTRHGKVYAAVDVSKDTTISDIHKVREQISDRFNSDIHAIAEDARQRQEASGRPTVSFAKSPDDSTDKDSDADQVDESASR
jgi:hypothetical protein